MGRDSFHVYDLRDIVFLVRRRSYGIVEAGAVDEGRWTGGLDQLTTDSLRTRGRVLICVSSDPGLARRNGAFENSRTSDFDGLGVVRLKPLLTTNTWEGIGTRKRNDIPQRLRSPQ
jgi:hypothetical protein